ncbi:sulfurtransferase [Tenacibaculum agarivorans]|uniref:sulfurtransferase n=1 Tax=Tenacibaculum agarivorans TaxID=1908389 RepID=UPI00094BA955|nr:sulfurtransferase [Tenacibaculum agarivorans]
MLKIDKPLVSVSCLNANLSAENLIVLDATIPKVTSEQKTLAEKVQIPGTIFFDLRGVFLDKNGLYPNTLPSEQLFEEEAQKLGIHTDSCIVVYDDLGIYSSARVWWLFKTFGFDNIAVLDGGLPEWKKHDFLLEKQAFKNKSKGNFKAKFNSEKFTNTEKVLSIINNPNYCVADARSSDRFYGRVEEPRKGVRGGHIPNSNSLPYTSLQKEGKMRSSEELTDIFKNINSSNKDYIFTCGTGITACVIALALELTGKTNYAIYDGSWTEWGSRTELPIAL